MRGGGPPFYGIRSIIHPESGRICPQRRRIFGRFCDRPNTPRPVPAEGNPTLSHRSGGIPGRPSLVLKRCSRSLTRAIREYEHVQSTVTRIFANFVVIPGLTGGALSGIHRSGGARGVAGAGGDDGQVQPSTFGLGAGTRCRCSIRFRPGVCWQVRRARRPVYNAICRTFAASEDRASGDVLFG